MTVFLALKLILRYPFTLYPVFLTLSHHYSVHVRKYHNFSHLSRLFTHYHKILLLSRVLSHLYSTLTTPHAFTYYRLFSPHLLKPSKIAHSCVSLVHPSQYPTKLLKCNYERFWPQIWRFIRLLSVRFPFPVTFCSFSLPLTLLTSLDLS